jgi:hypothetical protein
MPAVVLSDRWEWHYPKRGRRHLEPRGPCRGIAPGHLARPHLTAFRPLQQLRLSTAFLLGGIGLLPYLRCELNEEVVFGMESLVSTRSLAVSSWYVISSCTAAHKRLCPKFSRKRQRANAVP